MDKTKTDTRRAALLLCVGVTAAVLAAAVQFVVWLTQKGHAKTTLFRMARLEAFLVTFQPADTTIASLLEVARREQYEVDFCDGWGNDFIVSVAPEPEGRYAYTVRSLGRDGQQGACCTGVIRGQWDDDAVLSNGKWLQVW